MEEKKEDVKDKEKDTKKGKADDEKKSPFKFEDEDESDDWDALPPFLRRKK
jgi:hypothetical protein